MNDNQQDKLRKEFISLGKDIEKLLKASEDFEKQLNREFMIMKKQALKKARALFADKNKSKKNKNLTFI